MDDEERKRLAVFLADIADLLLPHIDRPTVTATTTGIDGDTPLHVAAFRGATDMVSALIDVGATLDAKGDLSVTPLYQAVMEGHVATARRLLEAGADPDAVNELMTTPRKRAAQSDDPAMRRLFETEDSDG